MSVDILELDANGEVLAELSLSAEFQDGDTFVYDTLVGQNKYDPDKLPQGLKMNMIAKDGDDKEIVQSWSISFQSTCNSFPVLQRLQSIGWVVMVSCV